MTHHRTLIDELFEFAHGDLDDLIAAADLLKLRGAMRYQYIAACWVEQQDANLAIVLNRALGMNVTQTSRKILPAHNGVHS